MRDQLHSLRTAIYKTRLERELEEEIAFHLEMRRAEGNSAADVQRQFGNTVLTKERMREMHTSRFLESVEQDVRYAIRSLRRTPGFTAIAVLSLALGIGANTAIFTATNAILIRTLPVDRPEELRAFSWSSAGKRAMSHLNGNFENRGGLQWSDSFSYEVYKTLRRPNPFFESVFAFKRRGNTTVTIRGRAELVSSELVSGNLYSGLGLRPALGRAITPGDDRPGAPPVALVSYAYWARRFGKDRSVLGATISVNTKPFTVIGVNPPDFAGFNVGPGPEVFLPLAYASVIYPRPSDPKTGIATSLLEDPDFWWVQVMGRIRRGVSERQSIAAFDVAIRQSIRASMPQKKDIAFPQLEYQFGGRSLNRGEFSLFVYLLSGMVGLVLLIACANIANLMLARAAASRREIAVRLALGAGRWRIVRQILATSLLLSFAGGTLGFLIGYGGKDLIPHMFDDPWTATPMEFAGDYRVLLFTLSLCVFTAILFGLIPALRATKPDVGPALKAGSLSASQPRSHMRLGKLLVVSQIALSILLTVAAGLFARTLVNLKSVDPGFNPERILLFAINPPKAQYSGERRMQLLNTILDRARAIPGVQSASLSGAALISGSEDVEGFVPSGRPERPGGQDQAWANQVGADFFKTVGIPILAGRAIDEGDRGNSPKVAVINQTLARRFFPNENPLGRTFNKEGIRIVGICADAHYSSLRREVPPTFYYPFLQETDPEAFGEVTFELKTAGNPTGVIGAVRDMVAAVDKDVPPYEIRSQVQQIDANISKERVFATLTTLFSLLALALACIGIYGIMAYTVSRRTNEIGIRMALGAQRAEVLSMILREASIVGIAGIAIGLAAAIAATRAIAGMLYGLQPQDPVTLALAAALMLAVTLTASLVPARRAAHVEPITALRYE